MPSAARPLRGRDPGAARGRAGRAARRARAARGPPQTVRQDVAVGASPHRGCARLMAMLEVYLIRHGIAAERGKDWPDDSKRPLTPEGLVSLRKEARALNKLGVTFD